MECSKFINGYPESNEVFEVANDSDAKILEDFEKTKVKIAKNISDYRLDYAINEIYEFFGENFATSTLKNARKLEDKNLRPLLKEILVMMHPFAPL